MYRSSKCILAAAVMCVSGVSFAQSAGSGQGTSPGSDQRDARTGIKDGTKAESTAQRDRAGMTGGSDQQSVQQIRQFAQNADTAGDKMFVLGNAEGNLWEVELSKVVQQKSQDQQVKELAKMVEQDHTQANEKLRQVAQKLDVQVPTALGEMKQAKLEVIRSMPADKLDKCYLGMLKADHAKDIIAFSIAQDDMQNQDLKQYISEVLPKLKEHGQHVQQVATAKGVGGGDITTLASATTGDRNMNPNGMNTSPSGQPRSQNNSPDNMGGATSNGGSGNAADGTASTK